MGWKIGDDLDDGRHRSPSADRNRGPILEVLRRVLPSRGLVLEIASGTGQHAVHFAAALPGVAWQPSDSDPDMRRSVSAWARAAGLPNLREPIDLEVMRQPWPIAAGQAVVCINMIHVAPWAACTALMAGAGAILPPEGVLFLYGPYRREGRHTAPSNEAFDASLRAHDPAWGVRDLEAVVAEAKSAGFSLGEVVEMPANNFSVVFRRG